MELDQPGNLGRLSGFCCENETTARLRCQRRMVGPSAAEQNGHKPDQRRHNPACLPTSLPSSGPPIGGGCAVDPSSDKIESFAGSSSSPKNKSDGRDRTPEWIGTGGEMIGGRDHFQSSHPLVTIEPWSVEQEPRKAQSIRTTACCESRRRNPSRSALNSIRGYEENSASSGSILNNSNSAQSLSKN